MSFEITTAFVEGFKNNIYMLSQQKTARLFGKSRNETQASETDHYERIGEVESQPSTERHGDTPILNTPHSRRSVTLQDTEWGDMIDRLDRVRLLINPDDSYVQAAIMELNRQKDDVFIAAALGNAHAGKKANLVVPLPDTQKLVAINEITGIHSGLNVYTLTLLQEYFDEADVDEDMTRYLAISSKQRQNLLRDKELTSEDFATVKALVQGKTDHFMNFNFIRSQRIPVTSAATVYEVGTGKVNVGGGNLPAGARRCFAWIEDGMISVVGEDLFVDIGPRRDKKMNTQIFVEDSVGAVRMEEVKVVELLVAE